MQDVFELLKREMRSRGWNVSRLAEACGTDVALTSRWVAENPDRRVIPGPKSCAKISAALGLEPDYVLELAGHRTPAVPSVRPTRLAAFLAQVEAAFRVYSEQEWEVREEAGRALFSVPNGQQHPVRGSKQGGFSPTARSLKGHKRGSNGGLADSLPRFNLMPRQLVGQR